MIPIKLREDSIVEAVCQLQFETTELSEVILGRLLDIPHWKDFEKSRLPVAEIPEPLRKIDLNIKYQPLFDLRNPSNTRLVRIGHNTISYHILQKYCGWDKFRPELEQTIKEAFKQVPDMSISRIGLRYINSLTKERHYIDDVNSLNVHLNIGNIPYDGQVNINLLEESSEQHITLTRIASPSFVAGEQPAQSAVIVDVDVYTKKGIKISNADEALNWINDAHDHEKTAFFNLIPKEIIKKLI